MSGPVPTEACPTCARANANWRVTCLYCGAKMPNPAPPPPPKAVPDNLDALVRDAMRGGSLDAVRRALADARPAPEPPPPGVIPFPTPSRPAPVPAAALPSPSTPSLTEALDALVTAACAARATADPAQVAAHLDAAARALAAAQAHRPSPPVSAPPVPAPEPEAPPPEAPLVLPPFRHPWALVLDGVGEPTHAPALAAALEVDPATARGLATVRHLQVALRAAERGPLDRRVASLHAATPFRATVVARAELLDLPRARPVLSAGASSWALGEGALWNEPPDPQNRPPGTPFTPGRVRLALPGEVVVRATRAQAERSRWLRTQYTGDGAAAEVHVAVVDLHTDDGVLRLTDTVTDLRGWEEVDLGATGRTFKRLVERLGELFPEARVEARRVCAAAPTADPALATGWPQWEEYTRLARRHAGI